MAQEREASTISMNTTTKMDSTLSTETDAHRSRPVAVGAEVGATMYGEGDLVDSCTISLNDRTCRSILRSWKHFYRWALWGCPTQASLTFRSRVLVVAEIRHGKEVDAVISTPRGSVHAEVHVRMTMVTSQYSFPLVLRVSSLADIMRHVPIFLIKLFKNTIQTTRSPC